MKGHTHISPRSAVFFSILALCRLPAKQKILCMALLFPIALISWPLDVLVIYQHDPQVVMTHSDQDNVLFMAPAPLGQEFRTRYIHSLERTPVMDCYRVVNGQIWSWQEHVQSHNAGLPYQSPQFGRFRMNPPWMIVEGGRQAWQTIILRVGNTDLGHNEFSYGGKDRTAWTALYTIYTGKRLRLEIAALPLYATLSEKKFLVTGTDPPARQSTQTAVSGSTIPI